MQSPFVCCVSLGSERFFLFGNEFLGFLLGHIFDFDGYGFDCYGGLQVALYHLKMLQSERLHTQFNFIVTLVNIGYAASNPDLGGPEIFHALKSEVSSLGRRTGILRSWMDWLKYLFVH